MILEIHVLQNFAPSNLNRDDTGAPKECEFGGVRRARISSQCIKRSVRNYPAFKEKVRFAGGDLGLRTRLLMSELLKGFKDVGKVDNAESVACQVIEMLGLKLKDKEKTEYLLYLGKEEIERIVKTVVEYWDTFDPKDKDLIKMLKSCSSGAYAADIAMFGRMAAGAENINVNAACQVAQAISVNRVDMEMDYFTAVDDLLPEDTVGAGMIGMVEFNSSCFYRYSLIDIDLLKNNLGYNNDLLSASVLGFAESFVKAIPTGKQNSMSAHNPPSYVGFILKNDNFASSFANAFVKPVKPMDGKSLSEKACESIREYKEKLKSMYGVENIIHESAMCEFDKEIVPLSSMLTELKDKIEAEA